MVSREERENELNGNKDAQNWKTNSQRVSSKETNGRLEQSMIKSMLTANGIVDATDTVYTVPDIAKMLQRKECTIRRRIENGQIPAHKMGRCWYILKSELVAGLRDT